MALLDRFNKDTSLPVPTNPLPPRLSHRAAAVADEMERLETELDRANAYGQEQENRAKVAENLLAEERKEKMYLMNTNDKLLRRSAQLVALLNAAGDLIERCKSVKDLPANDEPPEAMAKAIEEAAAAGPGAS